MTTIILDFPQIRRIVGDCAGHPPLWEMVKLLQLVDKRTGALDSFERHIVAQAEAVAFKGEDAPVAEQIACVKQLAPLLNRHYFADQTPYAVAPSRGELRDFLGGTHAAAP